MNYLPTIGLEIHVELKTASKMFCSCKNGLGLEREPNIHICPTCTGQPGTLPLPNRKAIESVIKAGLALNCDIAKISKFDRKNYFYPDLPKGYQISQYDQPICKNGYLEIEIQGEKKGEISKKKIGITRIHIEEDTGKSNHELAKGATLLDFNRAGVPLMELVSDPDITSAEEAGIFCRELQKIFRYLDISDADMEKGHMRCEANISVMDPDLEHIMENFGTKVEVKNLNSFKAVEKAILYEIKRQSELLDAGKKVISETLGWDDAKGVTYAQRTKEGAADYRYFPEPDIPPFEIDHQGRDPLKISLPAIRAQIPELPSAKTARFAEEYSMDRSDAAIIAEDKILSGWIEDMISELAEWHSSHRQANPAIPAWEDEKAKLVKMATGWYLSKVLKILEDKKISVNESKITAENFAQLITLLNIGKINSSAGQEILMAIAEEGGDPEEWIRRKNLGQVDNDAELSAMADRILLAFPVQVSDYKAGKKPLLQFLVGQVMKESKGKANPGKTATILEGKLK
ncbi:MAG: aspartyl-tRNA(Asn)/glutamyl-tRNA (Gln) amidotransferase subunit B [Parcubacteria group bacterium Gr01-1014_18]|nr:MAG: aspartyl-tRNA(Asn)/glutamyl-tRNA (Gln) amidotransferase subunit B [Parcubacteria group bacterium Greene0416_36]TSC79784.1 MAG: aspartyl-tRNA(Asn)/glutamyl-tRNA (Gln) amidotransferase subunit B [Parcubacteria group bacterium Gr01-1014_18]TSC98068.1 MAG: aspartyl-tRNA(Asn)/glutamyl-tRNA (Gln) amidotransferase subunit B [Parcubacteria group bacterium Greene1014_20]TSD06503.1 MAG: aspartyl-tRNA(Asn)/glutamyl-tRNA (Gln) amidotransferase subunit B [Parcubacteria group bacterium Greene0714_2]